MQLIMLYLAVGSHCLLRVLCEENCQQPPERNISGDDGSRGGSTGQNRHANGECRRGKEHLRQLHPYAMQRTFLLKKTLIVT